MSTAARVLIIEDDDDLRDTLVRYLGGVGMLASGLESAEGLDGNWRARISTPWCATSICRAKTASACSPG